MLENHDTENQMLKPLETYEIFLDLTEWSETHDFQM